MLVGSYLPFAHRAEDQMIQTAANSLIPNPPNLPLKHYLRVLDTSLAMCTTLTKPPYLAQ